MSGRTKVLIESLPHERESVTGFDEVFTLHHRVVYRVALAQVRDAALAEDITQEVFLRYYRHHSCDRAPAERDEFLRAWLVRVTLNCARNTIRGNTRAMRRGENYMSEAVRNETHLAPDDDYERRLKIEATRAALDKIGEPNRSCLLLQGHGMSYREIAHALNIKETTVGSYIARGRKEFVRVFEKIGGRKT